MAVFSPIPGTPGILSEASPCKALKSITCSGFKPSYFSARSFASKLSRPLLET